VCFDVIDIIAEWKKTSSQVLSKSKVDSSSVISKPERGHFMSQKASIFCISPEPERLVSESVPGGNVWHFSKLGIVAITAIVW